MDFDKRKTATLSALASSVTDKSPKGTVDTPIIPLLTSLNSHPNYFTTSSCSGRISILAQPTQKSASNKKKARGGSWLFISHSLSDPDTVVPLVFSPPPESVTESSELVFRFEPLIIAVECKDVEAASFLVALANRCGFRESGITSVSTKRVIAGIRCSIRIEVPLGETDNVLVTSEYVKFLVDVANQKMEANRKRTEGFFQALLENGFVGATVNGNGDPGDGDGSEVERLDEDVQAGVVEGGDGGGKVPIPDCSASASQIVTVGEPVERIFLWGHSASTLLDHSANGKHVVVFGGFGGMGRHSRRNDALLLDPSNGTLTVIDVEGAPSSRLGHTASLVGDFMFVIGGRADPVNILDDVWALNTVKMEWKLVKCTGSLFPPRHRHAAAVIGSKIYVFGGLNNGMVSSSLHVLDTESLKWEEVWVGGEQPCARHSHTMVAYGSKVFMFGGYNGEKALGDLYSFDVRACTWKKENTIGRSPHARFSHSMFVHKKFLGIVGGCPFRQHFQELALLDLQLYTWKHVTLDCIGKELLVRCTVNVVDNYLVMIGGGAACYAFGTKFSVPFKVNLLPLMSLEDRSVPSEIGELHVTNQSQWVREQSNANNQLPEFPCAEIPNQTSVPNFGADRYPSVAPCWVLQLEKKHGKFGKDILKKFGWLDLGRKVYSQDDGLLICFPVTEKFRAVFLQRQLQYGDVLEEVDDMHLCKPFSGKVVSLNVMSCLTALDLLKEYGASMLVDQVGKVRQTAKPPLQVLNEAVGSLIKCKGLPVELLDQLPTRWERLGDIVVLPVTSFKDPMWDSIGEDIWPIVARSLNTRRLARQGRVASTGTRDSTLEILVGHNGWVDHRENGILYSFDTTKCMFSWGNLSEKLRMANLNCVDEVIVDLFAGIGYFVLPFLVRAKAKLVYACEWNPHAVETLKRNLEANSVSDQCIVLEGDNRMTAPKGVADRVCLGLIPSSEGSWLTAVRALRAEGGVLHVHGNVKDSEEGLWNEHVLRSFSEIARSEGHCWELSIEHVERVKWYAPHIRHVVADVRCRQILR